MSSGRARLAEVVNSAREGDLECTCASRTVVFLLRVVGRVPVLVAVDTFDTSRSDVTISRFTERFLLEPPFSAERGPDTVDEMIGKIESGV